MSEEQVHQGKTNVTWDQRLAEQRRHQVRRLLKPGVVCSRHTPNLTPERFENKAEQEKKKRTRA